MYYFFIDSTSTTPSLDSCGWGNDTGTIQTTNYPGMYENSEDWCITLYGDVSLVCVYAQTFCIIL